MSWIGDRQDVVEHDSTVSSWVNGWVVDLFTKVKRERQWKVLSPSSLHRYPGISYLQSSVHLPSTCYWFQNLHLLPTCTSGFRHICPMGQLHLDVSQASWTQNFTVNSPSSSSKATPTPKSQSQGIPLSFNKKLKIYYFFFPLTLHFQFIIRSWWFYLLYLLNTSNFSYFGYHSLFKPWYYSRSMQQPDFSSFQDCPISFWHALQSWQIHSQLCF